MIYFHFHKKAKVAKLSVKHITQLPLTSYKNHKVLVAPLDWGLGHATRCIPIIRALQLKGDDIIIAAEKAQAVILKQEFPAIRIIPLRGYRVKYSRISGWLVFKLLFQLPKIFITIQYEHKWLKKTVQQEKIDWVISDNRYGLYHSDIPCYFITHQLNIKAPVYQVEQLLQKINYHYINRFTACWVPDMETFPGIGAELSHPLKKPSIPVHYINLLSRFNQSTATFQYDLCVLLSGPEPQRTMLEQKILQQLAKLKANIILVRGKPGSDEKIQAPDNTRIENHLPTHLLGEAIQQSEFVLSRSGYTSVMELIALKKKMILIPTPNQTEQEYLGKTLMKNGWALSYQQDVFNLLTAFKEAQQFTYQHQQVTIFDGEEWAKFD